MNILSEIKFTLRLLRKQIGSTAMAVLVMAVGTGVAITMFAFVNGIMWSPIGMDTKGELVHLEWDGSGNDRLNSVEVKPQDYEALRDELDSFQDLESFAFHSASFYNPAGSSYAKRYEGVRVTSGFFDLLGEPMLLGRGFEEIDVAGSQDSAVVLSYEAWQDQFGGADDAIGASAVLDGRPHTIVGIARPGFAFPGAAEIWVATDWQEEKKQGRDHWRGTEVIGVLKEGVTVDQVLTEIEVVAQRLANEFPETNEKRLAMDIKPYNFEVTGEEFYKLMYAMLFCAGLVLAVACANVFNVIMARAAKRTNELSIRASLGATRGRIVFQVILDGLLLSILGSIGGVVIATWALKLIWMRVEPLRLPYWWHMDINGTVVAFIVGVTIVAAIGSSLIPGLRAARASTVENLKDDSRTSSSLFIGFLSKGILGVQIVFTGLLLFVGVMMMLVWNHLDNRDYPFEPSTILQTNLSVAETGGESSKEAYVEILKELKGRLEAVPGVEGVSYSPMYSGIFGHGRIFELDGEVYDSEESKPQSEIVITGLDYEKVFKVEPLAGRAFNSLDTADSERVCQVNKAFADHYWPNEDPLGKRIKILNLDEEVWRTVVGVMPNVKPEPLPGEDPVKNGYTQIFMPHSQNSWPAVFILLRAQGDPHRFIETMRRELRVVAPQLAFQNEFITLEEIIDRNMAGNDILMGMFGVFGIAALIKATIGLYAIMSFTTRQRFREFGIRMALGANTKRIMILVLKQGALLLPLGSLLGIALGHAVALVLKNLLQMNEIPIGLTYPVVAGILIVAAIAAMGGPAWSATRITPMKALRVE